MRKRFWTKQVKILLSVAAVLAVLVTLGAALRQGASAGFGQNLVSSLLMPVRSGIRALDSGIVKIYDYIYRYETLQAENDALREKLAEAEAAVSMAESYRRENQRLRELLQLEQENEDFTVVAAHIIARDTSVWNSRITVDKGENAGLAAGMCAITSTGQVVGLVTECGTNWASISTVYDISVSISGEISATGHSGVVQATRADAGKSVLQMRYLPTAAQLKNGERVVTSGSASYPRGLLLGTVSGTGQDETGISKYATLETELELGALEQIFVLTDYER